MMKKTIDTIHERNRIINAIVTAMVERQHFVVVGHRNPDEDCIASMVAFALLLTKFSKDTSIYISEPVHEHFGYLLNIATYNGIRYLKAGDRVGEDVDTVVICDTAKPSMIDLPDADAGLMGQANIVRIEFDHHTGADSAYIGDSDYSLVTDASSSCELVGLLGLKLCKRIDLIERFNVGATLTRNFVLCVLTGIIGDTNMGQFIKSRREKRYYDLFSSLYNEILIKETTNRANFIDKTQVFQELQRLTASEARCREMFLSKRRPARPGGIVAIVLDRADMETIAGDFDEETVIAMSRTIADIIAEESGRLGLVAYDDRVYGRDLVQCRLRRSQNFKSFDVRTILTAFGIANGGGHEGAIGFRVIASAIPDLRAYVEGLAADIEAVAGI